MCPPARGVELRWQDINLDAGVITTQVELQRVEGKLQLRHTCASLLLVQGVHPRVVMEILGHSQISLTMNTYSHVAPQLQDEAAQRMNDLFSNNG